MDYFAFIAGEHFSAGEPYSGECNLAAPRDEGVPFTNLPITADEGI